MVSLKEIKRKDFANGSVYMFETYDGYHIECTDTFLPCYTKDAIDKKQNGPVSTDLGSRQDRWVIDVSVMVEIPIDQIPIDHKSCDNVKFKKDRFLHPEEIFEQVLLIVENNPDFDPAEAKEFKINYTRMDEPFLDIDNVRKAIMEIDAHFYETKVHHYISTIDMKDYDFSWIKDNVTLHFKDHSFDESKE